LDRSSALFGLADLGFSPEVDRLYREVIARPYGLVLVTGPTGSGKSSTLYATLSALNSPEKNIITIEDPVEYHLKMIRQSQVNPKAGLTFATGLRSILRQDPDIIMVGEIRDKETAEMAIQAALTGHLVLSTLHTNDATGTISRLADMGVEPFLLTSSLAGVLAQRLVRSICDQCKAPYPPAESLLAYLGLKPGPDLKFHRGKGCPACRNTGYRGRLALFEFLPMNERIRSLILSGASKAALREEAAEDGMKSLREDGIQKVLEGRTTLEEILRATQTET
jgi:type II secretory ATPase GspE/PulE/Tfp pilus assembly ATPase PilB-like protein